MQLRSLSASSITTYEGCKVRWYADYVRYAQRTGGTRPADAGTTCHGALQNLIQMCFLDEGSKGAADSKYTLENLLMLMKVEAMSVFNTSSPEDLPEWDDMVEMLTNWFNRTEWSDGVEVVSVEKKMRMPVKTSQGEVPFTFICDRVDRWVEPDGKRVIRIVDYKTIREFVSGEDLGHKIQPRAYAMAAQWAYKGEFDELWVCFDLLRYGPVERMFTRDEAVKTYRDIQKTANSIIADDPEKIKPTLSPDCTFCTLKTTCKAVRVNASVGGSMSLMGDLKALAETRMELEGAKKAATYGLEEIDAMIVAEMKKQGDIDTDLDHLNISIKMRKTTSYDATVVRGVLGPEIYSQIGSITNASVDKLLKGDELTDEQKAKIRQAKEIKVGAMYPKVSKRVE